MAVRRDGLAGIPLLPRFDGDKTEGVTTNENQSMVRTPIPLLPRPIPTRRNQGWARPGSG